MGISHFGEMDRLGAIARPDYVVFTNIGNMHLENLIDRSGVLRAKTEVVKHMPHNGRLFFNAADDKLCEYAKTSPIPVKFYGMDESLPVHPENIRFIDAAETDFVLNYFGTRIPVSMPAAGLHMVQNAVAAAAAAHELGLTAEQVKAGIESFSPVGHRWRVLFACCLPAANAAANNADANFEASSASAGSETFTVIDDCYNAGPDSVRAALTALVSAAKPGCRKSQCSEICSNWAKTPPHCTKASAHIAPNAGLTRSSPQVTLRQILLSVRKMQECATFSAFRRTRCQLLCCILQSPETRCL